MQTLIKSIRSLTLVSGLYGRSKSRLPSEGAQRKRERTALQVSRIGLREQTTSAHEEIVEDMMDLAGARFLYKYPQRDVIALAIEIGNKPFAEMSVDQRSALAKYAACPYCCELFLQAKARSAGKTVVYIRNGMVLDPVPVETESANRSMMAPYDEDLGDGQAGIPPRRI